MYTPDATAAGSPSTVTARFTLGEEVAHGSSGAVVRGRDRVTGAPVAVKRFHAHVPVGEALRAAWREATLLGRVDSPYVVKCLAHGVDDEGSACLVLEWIEGEDLDRRQRTGPLGVAEAVEIVRQAALGLAALHDAGIVHGDVKPSNFLVTEDATGRLAVKLVDLGIARASSVVHAVGEDLLVGTPAYLSPEQAREDDVITPAADQFSLGVVLYQLLARQMPFSGHESFAILAKIALETPVPLRTLVVGLAPEIEAVVERALEKLPSARYPSALAMAEALAATARREASTSVASDTAAPPAITSAATADGTARCVVTALFGWIRADSSPSRDYGWSRGDARAPGEADSTAPSSTAVELAALVTEHGGVAHRLMGSRVIGVFGGPGSTGDEPALAARAALAASGLRGARLALVTGLAAPGPIGLSGSLIEHGAAALARSGPGAIRLDETTARLLGRDLRVEAGELLSPTEPGSESR